LTEEYDVVINFFASKVYFGSLLFLSLIVGRLWAFKNVCVEKRFQIDQKIYNENNNDFKNIL